MAFTMTLWENRAETLVELPKQKLDQEDRLETWIEKDISLLGLDVLIVGRQVHTPFGGRIDLLALDQEGDAVIIELKRDKTPREVVAQVLDYASWVSSLTQKEVIDLAAPYLRDSLANVFQKRFGSPLPETVNSDHKMVVVAPELDDSSERIVQYLAARHSLDINVVFFTCFKVDGKEFVGRSWLMDPGEVEERSELKRGLPWSGYWFVNVGEDEHRNWDDCRKYGFLGAGQGSKYSDPLKKLKLGDRVFAYMKSLGYVGIGEITKEAVMVKAFSTDGKRTLLDLPLTQQGMMENSNDPNMSEWVVGVRWLKAVPREEARRFQGAFANQTIVCKLREKRTLDFLKREFGVEDK
jgi:Endonuclease NucS